MVSVARLVFDGLVTRPPENAVELRLRSLTDVLSGPIPQAALDAVEGFRLRLRRPADLSGLAAVRRLQWLAVESPYDLDLRHLPPSLRDLRVEAPIRDLTAVAALPNLTALHLGYTRVTDLGPVRHVRNVVVDHGPRTVPERGKGLPARLDGIQELIPGGRIIGLLLPEEDVVPFPPNAWGVTGGLTDALAHIWRGLADRAPWFVAAVHVRTVGLALLDNGSLAYLTWRREQDRAEPVRQAWQVDHEPDPYPLIKVVIGERPAPTRDGPGPLRAFWAVHKSLGPIGGELTTTMGDGRFRLAFGGDDLTRAVLDLALLDPAGDPTIATWAVNSGEIGDQQQFWDWLDGEGTRLVFL